MHEARTQVENHGRACTQVLFLRKEELGFFHFLEIVTGRLRTFPVQAWLVHSTAEDPFCLKTGFFRQVRELKNPGSALCLKKNVPRYMLFEVGVKSKSQSIINFKRIFHMCVYVCVCVCVYCNCSCCLCDGT